MWLNLKKGGMLLFLLRLAVVVAVTIAIVIGTCFIFLIVERDRSFWNISRSALMRTWFTRVSPTFRFRMQIQV